MRNVSGSLRGRMFSGKSAPFATHRFRALEFRKGFFLSASAVGAAAAVAARCLALLEDDDELLRPPPRPLPLPLPSLPLSSSECAGADSSLPMPE
jgi:hypothetical protein